MFKEAGGNYRPFRMILNRDDGSLGVQRAIFAFDQDPIGKFQRTVTANKTSCGVPNSITVS